MNKLWCLPQGSSLSWMKFWLALGLVLVATLSRAEDSPVPGAMHPATHIWTGGALTEQELVAAAEAGIDTVINLQTDAEKPWDERAVVAAAGMQYEHLPIDGEKGVTAENAAKLKAILDRHQGNIYLHCSSGNRAGALAALMARAEGSPANRAIELGKKWGLTDLEPHVRRVMSTMPVNKR